MDKNWVKIKFGKIGRFLNHANFSHAQLNAKKGTRCVHYGFIHASKNPILNSNLLPYITPDQATNYECLKTGDIIFTDVSEDTEGIGKAVCLIINGSEDVISGLHTIPFRCSEDYINLSFAPFVPHMPEIKNYLKKFAVGTKVYSITRNILSDIEINLPSKKVQAAIAAALSDADSLISSIEQLIAKKRLIKQGAMRELLTGRKRLPGFEEEWDTAKVSDIGEIITGRTPNLYKKEVWGNDFPWVTPTDIIGNNPYISKTERMLSEYGIKTTINLPKHTVLITCIASIGKNVILKKIGSCNQQINAIICYPLYHYLFIYYLLTFYSEKIIGISGITATRIVSKKIFADIEFLIPSKKEQTTIAAVLSDMDEEIAALEAKLEKARKIRAGMMAELLTGRIRLL